MKIFMILGIILTGTAISGTPGAYGALVAVALANCYKAFD